MALNPNIPLMPRAVDVGSAFQNALLNVGRIQNMQQQAEQAQQTQQINQQTLQSNALKQAVTVAPAVLQAAQSGDIAGLRSLAVNLPPQAQQEFNSMIESGDLGGIATQAQRLADLAPQIGLSGVPAGVREFETMTEGLTAEQKAEARLIDLGLKPRAGISAQERIATDPTLSQQVVEQRAAEAGAAEGAKLGEQAKLLPSIRASIKTAEDQAASRGEALSDLRRAEVAMPGLKEVVNTLRELAPIATSTFGGRIFDTVVKEAGFGATKGATARAKYTAIIDNQILPLLKQTFGAAFTAVEGERLRATLGDPDASPAEKAAQLDAFIDSKMRELQTKRAAVAATPDVQQMSDDELLGGF